MIALEHHRDVLAGRAGLIIPERRAAERFPKWLKSSEKVAYCTTIFRTAGSGKERPLILHISARLSGGPGVSISPAIETGFYNALRNSQRRV
jgi:hypothetical protein